MFFVAIGVAVVDDAHDSVLLVVVMVVERIHEKI